VEFGLRCNEDMLYSWVDQVSKLNTDIFHCLLLTVENVNEKITSLLK